MGRKIEGLKEIEIAIRLGQGVSAKRQLEALMRRSIPREEMATVAGLARRLDMGDHGIRLLHPIVLPPARKVFDATSKELLEYGACLVAQGIPNEGCEWLLRVESRSQPLRFLYLAFARIAEWRYQEAIPLLKSFLGESRLDDYHRLLGGVNLVACLIFERRLVQAERWTKGILEHTRRKGFRLQTGNLLELATQIAVFQGNRPTAEKRLAEARGFLEHSGTRDAYYARKWQAILQVVFEKETQSNRSSVEAARKEALRLGLWESVRHLDRIKAVYWNHDELIPHLYFGSPYPDFRRRLLADLKKPVLLPSEYAWNLKGTGGGFRLNLGNGTRELKKNQRREVTALAATKLLWILASDFYRPQRLSEIHAKLYPEEYFSPHSSPNRIHQVMIRLRRWFTLKNVPIEVQERGGRYGLLGVKSISVILPRQAAGQKNDSPALLALRGRWPDAPFTLSQACSTLSLPRRTVLRMVSTAVTQGKISKQGLNRATKYMFSAPENKSQAEVTLNAPETPRPRQAGKSK